MVDRIIRAGLRWATPIPLLSLLGIASTIVVLPSPGSLDWLRGPLADDAYYYLSIARNLGQGRGLTSDGGPVTGFQPVYLFLCWVMGWLTRWHPVHTPAAITYFNVLLYNVLGLLLLAKLWRLMAFEVSQGWSPWIPAFLWTFHAYGQRAAVNGMETTLMLLAWLVVLMVFLRGARRKHDLGHACLSGFALGMAFLVRNDVVVLVPIYYLWTIVTSSELLASGLRERLRYLLGSALAFSSCALPWVLYNVVRTGSFVPQSGRAEAVGSLSDLGRLVQATAVLRGIVANVLPVPIPLSRYLASLSSPAKLLVPSIFVALVVVTFLLATRQVTGPARSTLYLLGASFSCLAVVYFVAFAAPHMVTRWLAPGIVLGVILFGVLLEGLWRSGGVGRIAVATALVIVLVARTWTIADDVRKPYTTNTWPMLQYLVETRPEGHVASFQSGLLSWMLPDVTNLDGKTNIHAMNAQKQGRLAEWFTGSSIDLAIDWRLAGLEHNPLVLRAFAREDGPDGLVILRRRR